MDRVNRVAPILTLIGIVALVGLVLQQQSQIRHLEERIDSIGPYVMSGDLVPLQKQLDKIAATTESRNVWDDAAAADAVSAAFASSCVPKSGVGSLDWHVSSLESAIEEVDSNVLEVLTLVDVLCDYAGGC